MLLRSSQLIGLPVMSLQTGAEIAYSVGLIINPDTLRIVALELDGENLDERPSFLRIEDVRELSNIGFIVDSSDEFIGLEDVISIKNLYDRNFQPIDMRVIDEHKHKLGKVYDMVFSTDTFIINQLCVKRPLFLSLGDTELLINRTQIVDVREKDIVVRSTATKNKRPATVEKPTPLANPFKKPQNTPQPDTVSASDD